MSKHTYHLTMLKQMQCLLVQVIICFSCTKHFAKQHRHHGDKIILGEQAYNIMLLINYMYVKDIVRSRFLVWKGRAAF